MINDKLALVPDSPGCYQMFNKAGIIIYVGKAKNLKKRLSSYFRGSHTGKTAMLVAEIFDFEYIVVESESESLILELNLIKKFNPKYNILLRDDKSYPYIEFTNEKSPRLTIVRNLNKKKNKLARLYGPYPNVTAARSVVNLLNRVYPLRKCKNYSRKTCLYYHIGECLGYCDKRIDFNKVKEMETEIIKFLNGDSTLIIDKLEKEMYTESELLHFEKANEIKELIQYINITLEKQKVELKEIIDLDVFGYYEYKGYISVEVLFVRGGKIQDKRNYIYSIIEDAKEELVKFVATFYTKNVLLPKEVLLPNKIQYDILEKIYNISIRIPERGTKKKLVDMAILNSKINLENKFELIKKDEEKTIGANNELKKLLNLNKLDRIEIFDNSNLFGTYNVSGMVVFESGRPNKNEYRKYKISVDKNDDYGTMKEVIYRRYFKVLKDKLRMPDLIVVDGGLGQINAAYNIIKSLSLKIPVIGLKKNKKHTTEALITSLGDIIPIDHNSNLFYYLERIQDEVHNFTINYHKKIRSKGSIESILNCIPGIGDTRKKELLKKFASITKIKNASLEELKVILPTNVAKTLKKFLNNMEDNK